MLLIIQLSIIFSFVCFLLIVVSEAALRHVSKLAVRESQISAAPRLTSAWTDFHSFHANKVPLLEMPIYFL